MTFREKYQKGQRIGIGPFGNFFQCWLIPKKSKSTDDDSDSNSIEQDDEMDTEQVFTLKFLEKKLLSQSGVSGDLLIDDFKVLIDAHQPNIARMYDIFQDRKRFYIVQESLKEGSEDLHQRLQRVKCFTENQAIQIVRQILLALEFLHTKNILHRDLKSNNVSVNIDKYSGKISVKLTDFSLAVKVNPESGGLRGFAGTPEYMAPEVVRQPGNRALTPQKGSPLITLKADVFAIGILAYEVLTGSTAFSFACKSRMSLYSAILHQEPQFKERIFRKCSADCIDFIKQCLLKKAHLRPSTTDLLQHNWLNQESYEEMESAEMQEKF